MANEWIDDGGRGGGSDGREVIIIYCVLDSDVMMKREVGAAGRSLVSCCLNLPQISICVHMRTYASVKHCHRFRFEPNKP